jgi:WD40 repeat protein
MFDRKELTCMSITPDGAKIVCGSHDFSIKIWDIDTGNCLKQLGDSFRYLGFSDNYSGGHLESVNHIAITPDSPQIVSGSSDNTIRVWNIETGNCLHTLRESKTNSILCLAITPDGTSGLSRLILCVADLQNHC